MRLVGGSIPSWSITAAPADRGYEAGKGWTAPTGTGLPRPSSRESNGISSLLFLCQKNNLQLPIDVCTTRWYIDIKKSHIRQNKPQLQ